jgi:hypothetical protein
MLLLLGSSCAWSCCSAPFSRKTSAYVHYFMSETKFHSVWNNKQNYSCLYFNPCILSKRNTQNSDSNSRHSLDMIFSLFVHSIYIPYCRFQVFEYGHIFKGFICRFMLWFCPAFCSRNVNMYLVSSKFTSSPIFLLATINFLWFSLYHVHFYPIY